MVGAEEGEREMRRVERCGKESCSEERALRGLALRAKEEGKAALTSIETGFDDGLGVQDESRVGVAGGEEVGGGGDGLGEGEEVVVVGCFGW